MKPKQKTLTIHERFTQFVKPKYRVEIDLEQGTEKRHYTGMNRSRSKSDTSKSKARVERRLSQPQSSSQDVRVQDIEEWNVRPDTPNSTTSQTPLLISPSRSPTRSPIRSPLRSPARQSVSLAIHPSDPILKPVALKPKSQEGTIFGSSQTIIKSNEMDEEQIEQETPLVGSNEPPEHVKTFLPESSILSILSVCCYCLLPTSLISLYFAAKIQELVIQGCFV
jgi:hypothetical protein